MNILYHDFIVYFDATTRKKNRKTIDRGITGLICSQARGTVNKNRQQPVKEHLSLIVSYRGDGQLLNPDASLGDNSLRQCPCELAGDTYFFFFADPVEVERMERQGSVGSVWPINWRVIRIIIMTGALSANDII